MAASSVHNVIHLFNLGRLASAIIISDMWEAQLVQSAKRVVEQTRANALKFFGPRREPVPPTVLSPPRIHATTFPPQMSPLRTPQIHPLPATSSQLPACNVGLQILEQFRMKIEELPQNVPEALDGHPVAAFLFNPVGCVGDGEDAWEKWDGPLDTLLQRDPEQLRELVVRGEKGLTGLHNFLHYLVTIHGVKGVLIEMKIEAAHSSRLVLRSDNEAEGDGDDDSDSESDVCDETPEEQVNDDGQAEVQDETERVEESEGNPQDKTKSVVDNLSNADDAELPTGNRLNGSRLCGRRDTK